MTVVERTPAGDPRVAALHRSAVELGSRVAAGRLSLDQAATALVDAADELELDDGSARGALFRGLVAGMNSHSGDEPPPTSWGARLRLLGHHARPQWAPLLAVAVLTATTSLLAAFQPLPLKILADYAIGGEQAPAWLASWAGGGGDPSPERWVLIAAVASLVLGVGAAAVNAGLTWFWEVAGLRMVYDLTNRLHRHLQRLSIAFHHRRPLGDSLSRLTEDTWAVYAATDALVVAPLAHLAVIGTIGVAAWILDPRLAALSLVVAPLLGASAFWFGRHVKVRARRLRDEQADVMGVTQRTLAVLPLVQSFAAHRRHRDEFDQVSARVVDATRRQVTTERAFGLVNAGLTATGMAVVVYAGSRRVISGAMPVGTLLVFVAYLRTLQFEVRDLLALFSRFRGAEAGLDRVLEVLEAEVEVADPARPVAVPSGGLRGEVRLQGVTVGYTPGRPVLTDVDLHAQPGQTIALVGRTGAGKSTLASLIPRFFDPWAGQITIDGIDLRDLRLADLRRNVALVTQEPLLLPTTIADNIAYGRPDADPHAIEAAARAANAHEFIVSLPDGYQSVLGERGATLSGGQRQRLAIARALLKDAPVLVLDEPTAALDAQTEHLLLEALDHLVAHRTTFVIAHRLSTIRNAHQIAVLDHGRITHTGTHHELLHTSPLYRTLHDLSAGTGART